MNPLRQLIKGALTACLPPERFLVRGPARRLADRPTLSLTFDDGPAAAFTPLVLDALQHWHVTATFFVIGNQAEHEPALMERIVREGHELANHTYHHREPKTVSTAVFLQEIAQTQQLIQRWQAVDHGLVRPPKGELTWSKLWGLMRARQTVALWSTDPRDYRLSPDEGREWAREYEPQHGDIVLLHDNRLAAAAIVDELGRRGVFQRVRVAPLSQWLRPATVAVPSLTSPQPH
jgi:peptidoglycan/xylan/chitin deacetylase (PgdA/CDA1 family)